MNRWLWHGALTLGLFVGGCTPQPAPADADPAAVIRALDRNLPDAAPVDAALAPDLGPPPLPRPRLDQPERSARIRAGRADQRAGRLGKALAAFRLGWADEPSSELAVLIGVLLQNAGAHADALRWLERVDLPLLADFVAFRQLRSAAALGDADGALYAAERVAPGSRFGPHAARQAADALLAAGRPEDATAWLSHWLAHAAAEANTDLRVMHAEALAAAGRPVDAARAWRRLRVRHGDGPTGTRARKALARLRWQMPLSRWRAAQAPDPDEHLLVAEADLEAHRYEAVEAGMLAALQGDPLPPRVRCDTWWLLARARTRLRDHAPAAAAYDGFVTACPADARAPRARFAEARAWFTVDDSAAALRAARAVWQGWPGHRLADDARLLAARIEKARGEPAVARDHLEALLHATPDGDMTADAAWLLRTLGADAHPTPAQDRAHVGRLAYFRGRDALGRGAVKAARAAFREARHRSPSGYYGLLAALRSHQLDSVAFARREGPRRPLPPPALPQTAPGHREGMLLADLGLVQDAWWAFDSAGPGPRESGRYLTAVARYLDDRGHADAALRMFERDVPHLDGLRWQDVPTPWLDAVYPMRWLPLFTEAAQTHDLPLALLLALAHTESRFDARARSWAGACGPLQLLPRTAQAVARRAGVRGRTSCRRLMRPRISIPIAAQYLADLRARFGGHPAALALAYNAGPGNAKRWLDGARAPFDEAVEAVDFRQARRYVKRVIAAMGVYEGRLTGTLPTLPFDW